MQSYPGRRHDCANTGGHIAGLSSVRRTSPAVQARGVRKQQRLFPQGLLIVESLVMRQGLEQVKNMNHSGHVRVKQANEFEVAGSRETDGIGWRIRRYLVNQQDSRCDARGTIKAGSIRCNAGASNRNAEDWTESRR